jgi:aryl-alcohol dehydrogenase-like predicted oxidoreductase
MRNENCRTTEALLAGFDKGMAAAGLDYVDLWRVTLHEQSSRHTEEELEQLIGALQTAKKQGKARFTGFSSHDRPHIKKMIETYPDTIDVVVTPYTAKSKELPTDSVFEAVREHNVGVFGIKPFASGSLFANDAETSEENDERARLALRYILCNDAITAPIPGLTTEDQVDNAVLAVRERRELDLAEQATLDKATEEMVANLPEDYQWLRDFEWV